MRSILTTSLAIFVMAVTATARAEDPAEVLGRQLFQRGNVAYAEGRYTDALASFRESYQTNPRPTVLFNMARCEELLGEYEAAYLDYQRFLVTLPPADKRAEVEATLRDIEPKVLVTLRALSAPSGAQVFLDDGREPVGRTPAEIRVPMGNRRVRLVGRTASSREMTVLAKPGAVAVVDYAFPEETQPVKESKTPELGELVVRANVPRALIRVGGMPAATGSELRRAVPPGAYDVSVEKAGYQAWKGRVEVAPSLSAFVDIKLAQKRSQLAKWLLVGGSALALATGGTFGFLAMNANSDYEDIPVKSNLERAESHALWSDVFFGAGLVALTGAIWMHTVGAPEESDARVGSSVLERGP